MENELCHDCPTVITIKETVRQMEIDNKTRDTQILKLLEFMAGVNMLLTLSIGGGALSTITLILTIVTLVTNKP